MAFLVGAFIILFLTITSYAQHGTILNPKSGTKIAPGSQFNFTYMGRADYGVSSYSFHVWLLGEQILNDNPTTNDSYTYGWFFGRFDYPNWPAVPTPKNPAPPHFTMPDFSQDEGGWGIGKAASDVKFRLVVYEEYDDGFGAVGRKIGVASNEIIYNATNSIP